MSIEKLVQVNERVEKAISKRKGRYLITLSDNKTTFIYKYNPSLDLSGNYEIALISLDTYYSTPNITSANNSLKIWNGVIWSTISIPEGSYEIDAISNAINVSQVTFVANNATLKAVLKLVSPYQFDFDVPHSIAPVLGFQKRNYWSAGNESENTVDILSISNFKVVTNVVSGTYDNGSVGNTLYSFFPNVAPGYKVAETPPQPIYLPVSVDRPTDLYVALVDQDGNPISLRGEKLTIRFYIREL